MDIEDNDEQRKEMSSKNSDNDDSSGVERPDEEVSRKADEPNADDQNDREESTLVREERERQKEDELLKPADDEDCGMECNDVEEKELLNIEGTEEGKTDDGIEEDDQEAVSGGPDSPETKMDCGDANSEVESGQQSDHLENGDEEEKHEDLCDSAENCDTKDGDVECAIDEDSAPPENEENELVEDTNSNLVSDSKDSDEICEKQDENSEVVEEEKLDEENEEDPSEEASLDAEPVSASGVESTEKENALDASCDDSDKSKEISSETTKHDSFQICSFHSINSPSKSLKSKINNDVEKQSGGDVCEENKSYNDSADVKKNSDGSTGSDAKSKTDDVGAGTDKKEDGLEEVQSTTDDTTKDEQNSDNISSLNEKSEDTNVNEKVSAVTENCESTPSVVKEEDANAQKVNSEISTSNSLSERDASARDSETSETIDTSAIKKEPEADNSVKNSDVDGNAVKSGAQPQSAVDKTSQPATESSSPQSNNKDKNVTQDPKTNTESSDKSVPTETSSEVKIKEEALSPTSQNESKDDNADKSKRETSGKNGESTTENKEKEGSEADSSDAQKKTAANSRTCAECGVGKGLKYQVLFQGKTRFLCSDVCFKAFRGKQKLAPPPPSQGTKSAITCGICNRDIKNGQGFFPFSGDSKPVCSEECMVKYQQAHTPKPCCAQCQALIEGRTKCLIWETMEFCNEDCLGSYQSTMGSHCACCKAPVQRLSLGKYCVRFGADIRQFCTGKCLEEFKKGLKVCTFCQKDMSNTSEGFLAPIGDKFRDFCTPDCMERYEVLNAATSKRPSVQKCSVCQKVAAVKVQVNHKDRDHVLCSDPCIAAFRYTQKIYASLCDLCHKLFNNQPLCLQIDNTAKKFCTKTCLNLFVLAHRKIVPCTWCKVKKYNFDMIERVDTSNNIQQFCSLNCLSLFRVSLNATSSKCIKCDHCHMNLPAQYHLTMSDASIRNFCSYPCVIKFQGQFTSVPTLTTVTPSLTRQGPTPVGKETRVPPATPVTTHNDSSNNSTPIIANVMSLAGTGSSTVSATSAQKTTPTSSSTQNTTTNAGTATTNGLSVMREVHREVIVAPPVPRMLKNKMIMCKPLVQNKGVACKPHPCHKETQTDSTWGTPVIVPIPVPIYVPTPVHMFSRSVPFPMPFPVPIPVPIFIPTTRKTTAKVIKDIFEIQEKVPSNPYEAELLLMAEMVAADEDKTEGQEDTEEKEETEEVKEDDVKEDKTEDGKPDKVSSPDSALEDLEVAVPAPIMEDIQPVVQLTPLAPECILNDNYSEDSVPAEETVKVSTTTNSVARRGTKRTRGRGRGGRGRKKQKVAVESDTSDEEWLPAAEAVPEAGSGTPKAAGKVTTGQPKATTPVPPVVSVAPIVAAVTSATKPELKIQSPVDVGSPDANLCLKYMFGVNAWKHWVVQKNVQLEKGGSQSRRLKLFKTDLLQLSPDELNYSLCLFVKEVRKPNGEEYAPDSIYYLCLGVQMYLYENGRVDNIFTDPYYEKFTECLNDVLMKHDIMGTLRKEAHFVSRIEEEILWESKQLGAHSPQVLLNTLMYFNTKQFNLQTADEHLQLSFTYIMKGWRKVYNQSSAPKGSRCAVLRYYPPPARGSADSKKAWKQEDSFTYEQEENFDNPLRCPVKLYEFYLSKCPESIRQRNDLFYMCPERSCVPDSPVWYSMQALPKEALVKMLQRISLVREISGPAQPVSSENKANSD